MASEDIYGLLGLLAGLGGSYYMNQNNSDTDAENILLSEAAQQQQLDSNAAIEDEARRLKYETQPRDPKGYELNPDPKSGYMLPDSPLSRYFRDDTLGKYPESYMDPNSPDYDPQSYLDFDYFDDKEIFNKYKTKNPFAEGGTFEILNQGGRVGLQGGGGLFNYLGGENTGNFAKLEMMDALSNFHGSESILSMLGKLATMGVGMNEGGRVGLANGGDPYAGLNYGFVNNIFTPTGGTNIAPPVSGPGFGFQDFLLPPTASGTPNVNVTNPNTYNPIGGGRYDIMGNQIGGGDGDPRRQPGGSLDFSTNLGQAMYGTDEDGNKIPDGKYINRFGDEQDIDEDDYGARFFDFLSGVPNITNGYGLFDYFSADAREARKAEAEADKAAETEAAAAAQAQAQAAEAQAQAADKAAADKAVADAIAQGGTTGFNIADVKRESFRGRMDGGGDGYQGGSKKGDSPGYGNNRDFGGGPATGTSRF